MGEATKCSECGKPLKDQEFDAPRYRTGDEGSPDDALCDDCFDESGLEFVCCLCRNWEHEAYQDRIGDLLVIAEYVYGATTGLYRITAHPYYGGSLIGSQRIFVGAVERIGDVPPGVDTDGCPCGHCCRNCRDALMESAVVDRRQ